jgi:hypothetical protein
LAWKRLPVFARDLIIFLILYIVLWRAVSIHAVHRDIYSCLANQRDGLYTTLVAVEATLLGLHRGSLDHRSGLRAGLALRYRPQVSTLERPVRFVHGGYALVSLCHRQLPDRAAS